MQGHFAERPLVSQPTCKDQETLQFLVQPPLGKSSTMFNHTIKALSIAAALGLATTGVVAQTATPNQPATSVGVTPQDAKEATEKATPRSDTGTLVC